MEGDRDGMENGNDLCCLLCTFRDNGHLQPSAWSGFNLCGDMTEKKAGLKVLIQH